MVVDAGLQGGGAVGLSGAGIFEMLRPLVVAPQRLVQATDLRLHAVELLRVSLRPPKDAHDGQQPSRRRRLGRSDVPP